MRQVGAELATPANMKRYAEAAADMIKKRTRLGYGVKKDGGERERLKPLAPSTIETRKGDAIYFRKGGKVVRVVNRKVSDRELINHVKQTAGALREQAAARGDKAAVEYYSELSKQTSVVVSLGHIRSGGMDFDPPKLHPQTTPSRSNLTRGGELLDSEKVLSSSAKSARIGPSGTRKDGKKNADIAKYQADQGRPYNYLTGTERKRVQTMIRKDVNEALKKKFPRGK